MGDSDSEKDFGGSDAGSDDGGEGFDPKQDLAKLSDKERKKLEKTLQKWRIFVDFIFRHIAVATFKYNAFEHEELTSFMIALEKAEGIRENMKLKKGEEPRISSFKMMKDSTDLLLQHKYLAEANRIRRFLDITGRMRGIGMIATGFYKALKKGKVRGIDRIKYYLDYWKGFCSRSYDFTQLEFRGADSSTFNSLEKKYLVWPTVVRTAINLSQRFMKRTSESTGLELISPDPKTIQAHMQAAEFVLATKIEEMLFDKVQNDPKSSLLGSTILTPGGGVEKKFEMPGVEDVNPEYLKPIPDTGILLELPPDPPKDKKGKKGKKGKGKGKGKGRSTSASSHKGGKKKKRK